MKVGIETYNNISTRNYQRGDSVQYRLSNGVPNQITMLLSDFTEEARVRNIGLFMQDRWTVKRFTLQGGIRYENASSRSPEQVIGPSRMVPTPSSSRAGHRQGIQRHHLPRWSGGRCVRHRKDVAENQRRQLHGSGAVGGHLHRAQSGSQAVRRWRAAADDGHGPIRTATTSRNAIC